jgi:hypothetical protein
MLKKLILLAVIVGGVWFAGTRSVIVTDREIMITDKTSFTFSRAYVDVRDWSLDDYLNDRETLRALVGKGYPHASKAVKNAELKAKFHEGVRKLSESLEKLIEE